MKSGESLEVWLTEFQKFLRQEPCWVKSELPPYLVRVRELDTVIDAVDENMELKSYAKKVFNGYLDTAIDLNISSVSSRPTPVATHKINRSGFLSEILGDYNLKLGCLTLQKICLFCEKNIASLYVGQDHGIFFLYTKDGASVLPDLSNLRVAYVYLHGRKLHISKRFFFESVVWRAKEDRPYRVVLAIF
jgi:hypothetical protein